MVARTVEDRRADFGSPLTPVRGRATELWSFVLSNLLVVSFGGLLAALGYAAYRRRTHPAYRLGAVGIGLITAGTLVEPIYVLGLRGSYELGDLKLLLLHTVEGLVIALGLGVLFYSIKQLYPSPNDRESSDTISPARSPADGAPSQH